LQKDFLTDGRRDKPVPISSTKKNFKEQIKEKEVFKELPLSVK
jgi:hypothetical protein